MEVIMTPYQEALRLVLPHEARALYEALDQYTSNMDDYLSLINEDDYLSLINEDEVEYEKAVRNLAGAQAVLDRMNANLAALADRRSYEAEMFGNAGV